MGNVTSEDIKKLVIPSNASHKGQNGRLLIIGGSHLFHAASLWSLEVASRIVDLVHYSSVPENNELVAKAKEEFRNGIVVSRSDLESYIEEDDCILLGPGMTRDEETRDLTNRLLTKHPEKQWVIDAGALQMMNLDLIPKNAILTPHHGEYAHTFGTEEIANVAKKYHCILLLKGEKDIACSSDGKCQEILGGNGGMTKGGTGDVLAGLIAALACKNDPFLATITGSFINKKAGDELYKKVGPYFNATDLANQIPITMKDLVIK
jgi:hydroxyethylthiazole kinase-like uncharacterized protein yjeF